MSAEWETDVEASRTCNTDHVVSAGSQATIKKLYESAADEEGFTTWLDEPPTELSDVVVQKAERSAHAILLRYVKAVDDGGVKTFALGSLVIQSPFLKTAVRSILSKYPGAGIHSKEPKFKPPFEPFFHRWTAFMDYLINCGANDEAYPHIELLYGVLDAELRSTRHEVDSLTKHGVITFDVLWALYPPDTVVFARRDDHEHAYWTKSTRKRTGYGGKGLLEITVSCIDWDGIDYGYCEEYFTITEFAGEKKISELTVVPKKYHADGDGLLQRLAERGEKWSTLVRGGYKAYNGTIFDPAAFRSQFVEGRIIIDGQGYMNHNPWSRTSIRPMDQEDEDRKISKYTSDDEPTRKNRKKSRKPRRRKSRDYSDDDYVDAGDMSPYMRPAPVQPLPPMDTYADPLAGVFPTPVPSNGLPLPVLDMEPAPEPTELTPEQKAFCKSAIRGFCLTTKKWVEFSIDGIYDIEWNDDAFAKLVMAPGRKRLVRALVKEQSARGVQFDDIIKGKGLGLVMLLSGPPGTGKTLTAESIADALRLPLYTLSAIQLGDDIQGIERSLNDVFQLAAKWNAVLLLDEADAFLEKRSNNNSAEERERNKRVAAFLRLLEYYKGTLIMTTNRPITFDEAFYSRIHITLHFDALDIGARKTVWTNFLESANTMPSTADLNMLAQINLNGREIKNVMKMAGLLAKSENEALAVEHVMDVIRVVQTPKTG